MYGPAFDHALGFSSRRKLLDATRWLGELNQATNKVELKSSGTLTNSTALYAMTHTMLAAALTGGMVIAGISAWHLLRKNEVEVFSSSRRSPAFARGCRPADPGGRAIKWAS